MKLSRKLTLCCFTTCLTSIRPFDAVLFNQFVGFGYIIDKKEAARLALADALIKFEMDVKERVLSMALADINENPRIAGQAVHHAAENRNSIELREKFPCAKINQQINIMAN